MEDTNQRQKIINSLISAEKFDKDVTNIAIESLKNFNPEDGKVMNQYANVCEAIGRLSDMYVDILSAMVDEAGDYIYFHESAYTQEELETVVEIIAKMENVKELRQLKKKGKKAKGK
jgi:predicted transcriptional regulator YheO